jgi:hypothetical protein
MLNPPEQLADRMLLLAAGGDECSTSALQFTPCRTTTDAAQGVRDTG